MKLHHLVNKSPEFVYDYLTNMQKFVSVHPVIFKIDNRSNDHYLVHERLKLGFIPVSFTYPAWVEQPDLGKTVVIKAVVMNLTRIEMTFKITGDKNNSSVEENIVFKSVLPIKFIMQSIFKKQHTQLFTNISNL